MGMHPPIGRPSNASAPQIAFLTGMLESWLYWCARTLEKDSPSRFYFYLLHLNKIIVE